VDAKREKLIQDIWRRQGQYLWHPAINGEGEPLRIAGLVFRLGRKAAEGGATVDCEGVIVSPRI
jgi:hypothetical protein